MSSQITTNNFISNQSIELNINQNSEQGDSEPRTSNKTEPSKSLIDIKQAGTPASSNQSIVKDKYTLQETESIEGNTQALDEALNVVTNFLQLSTQNVNFEKDETSDKTIIKVFDGQSKDLIKQFPSEEVIDIANKILALRQDIGIKTGILLDEKV